MAKIKTKYVCQECGYETSKWLGRCPECTKWNTLVEEIEQAMRGKLEPIYEEKVLGQAEVRKLFKFSKVGTIAGSMVINGIIKRDSKARVIRDGIIVYDGAINTIAREKDQVKEVKSGIECGITIENFNDIKEKDIIEAYEIVEIER